MNEIIQYSSESPPSFSSKKMRSSSKTNKQRPCSDGKERVGKKCTKKCADGLVRDPVSNRCRKANKTRKACPEGLVRNENNRCVRVHVLKPCAEGLVRNKNNRCVRVHVLKPCPEGLERNENNRCVRVHDLKPCQEHQYRNENNRCVNKYKPKRVKKRNNDTSNSNSREDEYSESMEGRTHSVNSIDYKNPLEDYKNIMAELRKPKMDPRRATEGMSIAECLKKATDAEIDNEKRRRDIMKMNVNNLVIPAVPAPVPAQNVVAIPPPPPPPPPQNVAALQNVTILPNGKKRIQPVLIQP